MRELYRFNREDFTYTKIRKGLVYYAVRSLPYVALSLVVAALVVVCFYLVYDSPTASNLKQEEQQLATAINEYGTAADTLQNHLAQLQQRDQALYRMILNAEPPKDTTGDSAAAAAQDSTREVDLDAVGSRLEELSTRLQAQTETQHLMYEIAKANRKELARIPSIRPVSTVILSGFGQRRNPIFKKDMFHAGIDFKADMDTKVMATADGTVSFAGNTTGGSGIVVQIDHGNGYVTYYGHLNRVLVKPGKRVKRGDVIALSGNSGLTKGPHLYYEVRKDGKAVDPIDYFFNDLKPEELVTFRSQASQYNESMN